MRFDKSMTNNVSFQICEFIYASKAFLIQAMLFAPALAIKMASNLQALVAMLLQRILCCDDSFMLF